MIFFSLLSTAFSSIFYGLLVTMAIMALLYFMLRAINKGIVQTPVFYISGGVLAILLFIQTSLMIGAMQAKSTADAAQEYVNGLVGNYQGMVDTQECQEVINAVADEFPIIGKFVDLTTFYGSNVAELPNTIHASVVGYLDSYIWHRIWWILGVIVLGCGAVIAFSKPDNNYSYGRERQSKLASRHEGRRARTGSHQRVSRRR